MKTIYKIVMLLVIVMLYVNLNINYSVALNLNNIRWLVMMDCTDNYAEQAFQHLKNIGVQAIVEDIRWSSFEPTNGNFDFSGLDTHKAYCESVGLYWFPQIAIHYVPDWLYTLDSQFYFYDSNGNKASGCPPNFFHPSTNYYVDRAIDAFIDHYGTVPFVYISSGQWGEAYYPDGNDFYAFDTYTKAAWKAHTGDTSAWPFSSTSDTGGRGGTVDEFIEFWHDKMHDFITHTHQKVYGRIPSTPHGLKISQNADLGQYISSQIAAAASYGLAAASHGGPASQTLPLQTLGEEAASSGVVPWVESFLRPYAGKTNGVKETRDRLYTYGINGLIYAVMYNLVNFQTGVPPSGPQEEFYRLRNLIENMGFGFETFATGFWSGVTTGAAYYGASSSIIKEGGYSLYLNTGSSGTARVYRDIYYDRTIDDVAYNGGNVVLDGWRYLVNTDVSSSVYWIVEGYNIMDTKVMQAVYWAGASNPEQGTGQSGSVYYLKSQLDNSETTGEWIRTAVGVNQDIDSQYGSGTWDTLAIKKLRITNKIYGYNSFRAYLDEVKLTDVFPYTMNNGFETGDESFWTVSSASGYEVTTTNPKSGDYSLHFTQVSSTVQIYQDYEYSSGPVILDGWRYLVSSNTGTGVYWKILGYGADESLKYQGVYWFGATNSERSNSSSSYYSIKIQVDNASQTSQWINDIKTLNDDLDAVFGSGTWNGLGITKLRFMLCAEGGYAEAYIDNAQLKAEGPSTIYLAEGATYDGFDEYICVQNPTATAANVTITFQISDGDPVQVLDTIAATSRKTYWANLYGFKDSVSTKVECTNGLELIAERAMYLYSDTIGWVSGHASAGVSETSTTWYLAEGSTSGFDTWILVQNPNGVAVDVQLTAMDEDNNIEEVTGNIPANSRYSWKLNDVMNNRSGVSTTIQSLSGLGVISERAMYWDAGGRTDEGAHCSVGVTDTSTLWYLAEGSTQGTFDEFVLIQNPGNSTANVRITFMKTDGLTVDTNRVVTGKSRSTVYANDYVPGASISTQVESINGVGIIAERAMYWTAGGVPWAGGHCSVGVTAPATIWYLAEGSTEGSFDQWVLIQNPHLTSPANCTVTFMKTDGTTEVVYVTVEATGRYTIHVNDIVPNSALSTKVVSTNGVEVIVERAMYWDALGVSWADGHVSKGVPK